MSEIVWVAIISFAGTVLGSLIGVLASAKLTNFRLEQLEKKVEKHNNVVERVGVLEAKSDDQRADIDRCFIKIREIKA